MRSGSMAMLCAALVLVASASANATEAGCGEEFERWLHECSARTGVAMRVDHCTDAVAVINTRLGASALRVEFSRDPRTHAFVREHHTGLSPVGEFNDWSAEPAGIRGAFDAVRSCVAARQPTYVATEVDELGNGGKTGFLQLRIALFAAALCAWLALLLRVSRRGSPMAVERRKGWLDVAIAAGTAVAIAAYRHVAVVAAFFHQNGHGAEWVEMARCQRNPYGPGYASVFRLAARAGGIHAERAVFAMQEVLAGLAVVGMYTIARGLGASRLLAVAATVAIGIDPLLARMARSESYFTASLSLIVLALSALLSVGTRVRRRDPRMWIGAAIAGVLLSAAITIHPVAWVPAALVPAVLCLREGRTRERLVSTAIPALIVAAIVAILAAVPALHVLHASASIPVASHAPQGRTRAWIIAAVALPWILAMPFPRRARRYLASIALVVAAFVAERLTNMFGSESMLAPAVAWRMLFAATACVGIAYVFVRMERPIARRVPHGRAVLPIALLLLGSGHAALSWRRATTLPTDALESRAFAQTLQAVAPGTMVLYLGRAGLMVQDPPLYQGCGLRGPVPFAIHDARSIAAVPGNLWFHTSTCSSPDGRPICEAIERSFVLRPIRVERFPARPSLPYLRYDAPHVTSGLYEVMRVLEP